MNIRNLENTTILIDHNMLLTNMCEWLNYETVLRFLDDMHDNNKKLLSSMLVAEVSKKLMLVDLN
jgi:pentatricopeptide repeat protein